MSLVSLYEPPVPVEDPPWIQQFQPREGLIPKLSDGRFFDVVIVGGGIHGASLARLTAFNGLSTALLEMVDYAEATSSRSSKLAHGGFRYLQMGDIQQVVEAVRCREDLFRTAPHLVKPEKFLLPVKNWWHRRFIAMGLTLYDLGLGDPTRRHHWIAQQDLPPVFTDPPYGAFEYSDGVMDDTRLVIEAIIAARQEGALCLNYAQVKSLAHRADSRVELGWMDTLTGEQHTVTAGIVVNCAGPWAPGIGRLQPTTAGVRYSRGSHLLFSTPWPYQALTIPMKEPGRYYFVIPHRYGGTLVGTTEREVSVPSVNPIPSDDEVEEILTRLRSDLGHVNLDRTSLVAMFAGIRTLPLRNSARTGTSKVSRRHQWQYAGGMLTLLGGKYTTAQAVAEEALHKVYTLAKVRRKVITLRSRQYPGVVQRQEHLQDFRRAAEEQGVASSIVEGTIARFGALVRYMMEVPLWHEVVDDRILKGAIRFVILVEQARNVSGVLRHLSMDKETPVSEACRDAIRQELLLCGVSSPAQES